MKSKRILIVDDEQIIAENLRFILNEYGYQNVDVASDDLEAKELFHIQQYDLVLMDINLKETSLINGVDLAISLAENYSFELIYITAYADENTVQKAKVTSPSGYIVKPFTNSAIYANVEIALNHLNKEEFFSFSNKGMQQQINLSNISYLEAKGAYIQLYTSCDDQHLVRKSLTEFNLLFPSTFVRIHKSILINKNHIQAYTSHHVKVNDIKLSLGRTYKDSFMQQTKEVNFVL